ncbi:MAG: zinc transporter ZupT [Acholeplasma sp.]|nr:zinc transporter ZupT [Acholeplasma sp.]
MDEFWFALSLTILAGLSTGIGGLLAFHKKANSHTFLSFSLGFSAGVMLYVSFVEIFVKGKDSLIEVYGLRSGYVFATVAFFVGVLTIGLIDKLVPEKVNPHELIDGTKPRDKALLRMGIFSAVAIGIHNFPEGLATFIAALETPTLGIGIAVAIAIHNIPEGIAVAIPIYQATGKKKKAFGYALLSGLSEPVGALLGYFLLKSVLSDGLFGLVFAFVAGIMVYISLDELLPTAEKYGKHHVVIYGVILGMALMALSLIAFL